MLNWDFHKSRTQRNFAILQSGGGGASAQWPTFRTSQLLLECEKSTFFGNGDDDMEMERDPRTNPLP